MANACFAFALAFAIVATGVNAKEYHIDVQSWSYIVRVLAVLALGGAVVQVPTLIH